MELVFAPEKRRHLGRLDRMNGRTYERLIDGPQVHLVAEDNIGRVLDLRQMPVVRQAELRNDRAEHLRIVIQLLMDKPCVGLIRQLLSSLPIRDMGESV